MLWPELYSMSPNSYVKFYQVPQNTTVFGDTASKNKASLVAQMVKNLPAMQDTQVWSLGQEDLLEKEMATHSSILAWRIHRERSLVGYSSEGHKESDMTERLTLSLHNQFIQTGPNPI